MIVWDLFGGGQNSVYNALKDNPNYTVYTFDITEPAHEHQYHIDLSQDNIVDKFKDYPKPDIIVASPLCQSFSNILTVKGGGTVGWTFKDNQLVFRTEDDFKEHKSGWTKNLNYERQHFLAELGKKCIDNVLKLIDYYEPRLWYIENPATSLMWYYLEHNQADWCKKHNLIKNKACYGLYGFLTNKPTVFASNTWLNLLYGKTPKPWHEETINGVKYIVSNFNGYKAKKGKNTRSGTVGIKALTYHNSKNQSAKPFNTEQIKEAGAQSAIPHTLIQDIFKQWELR